MPILGSLASASSQSYGSRGLVPTGSALYDSIYDSLEVPASTKFQYGTGDFTIEMWIYPTSISGYGSTLLKQRGTNYYTQRYLFLWLHPNGQVFLQVAGNDYFVGSNSLTSLNAWNHVALVRRSGSMSIFLNGTPGTPRANTTNFSDASAYKPMFGSLGFNIDYWFRGNITNIRIAKSAYYITAFIPDRTPFTSTSQGATNVQLLLNFKNAAGLLVDSSASPVTVTNSTVSLVTYSALTPFSGAFVTPPVVTASAAVITSALDVDEGTSLSFTVNTTNVANGTTLYWTIELPTDGTTTSADFTGAVLSGSFIITSSSGAFSITAPTIDRLTEGVETFSVFVRSGSNTGIVLGVTDEITINDTSLTPAFTVNPGGMDEGASATYTVNNLGPAGTYYWTIAYNTGTSAADFSPENGSFTTSTLNGDGTFSVTAAADRLTEGAQTFQVQIRTGSISGTVILTSNGQSIIDTSLTPAFTTTPATINEGSSGSFVVNNLGSAGTYYWTVLNGTTADADFSAVNGSFTTSTLNGSGSFSVTPVIDYTTEGAQTFQVQIREGSIGGTVLVTSASVTVNDTSTTVTASGSPTSFNEGASTTITASATGFPNGTYFWTVLNGTTTNADFTATSGSFTVSNSASGAFTVTAATLGGAEGAETFTVQIRTGSTSGTVIATTGTLTINANAT